MHGIGFFGVWTGTDGQEDLRHTSGTRIVGMINKRRKDDKVREFGLFQTLKLFTMK